MKNERWIDELLNAARADGRERSLRIYPRAGGKFVMDGKEILNFSSNDYLGLAGHPDVVSVSRQALDAYGTGSTASRLVSGTLSLHEELEKMLARHKGYEAALVFGSGYMTNVGTVPALVGRGDPIFADRLIHASLLDAAALSRARLSRFQHNDVDHLRELLNKAPAGRKLILAESVYSMDGDLAPLLEIARVAEEFDAMLLVDEAHASGILGPHGSGRITELGLQHQVNVSMGTFSKALGGYGGFVACSERIRHLLIQSARSFIYTTAPAPAAIGGAIGALRVLEQHPDLGATLLKRSDAFRDRLQDAGLNTLTSACQIVPVLIGNNQQTMDTALRLWKRGVLAIPIRPPTVPQGASRLRLSVTLSHTEEDLEVAANMIIEEVSETVKA